MKTFTIDAVYSPASGRVLQVNLTRYGKVYESLPVLTDAAQVVAFWRLRAEAERLGATHVRILGKREPC